MLSVTEYEPENSDSSSSKNSARFFLKQPETFLWIFFLKVFVLQRSTIQKESIIWFYIWGYWASISYTTRENCVNFEIFVEGNQALFKKVHR